MAILEWVTKVFQTSEQIAILRIAENVIYLPIWLFDDPALKNLWQIIWYITLLLLCLPILLNVLKSLFSTVTGHNYRIDTGGIAMRLLIATVITKLSLSILKIFVQLFNLLTQTLFNSTIGPHLETYNNVLLGFTGHILFSVVVNLLGFALLIQFSWRIVRVLMLIAIAPAALYSSVFPETFGFFMGYLKEWLKILGMQIVQAMWLIVGLYGMTNVGQHLSTNFTGTVILLGVIIMSLWEMLRSANLFQFVSGYGKVVQILAAGGMKK